MLAPRHIGVEADHVGERHSILGQNSRDAGKAKIGLSFAIRGNALVRTNSELPRGEDQPVPGRHGDAVAVACKRRSDRWWGQSAQEDRSEMKNCANLAEWL